MATVVGPQPRDAALYRLIALASERLHNEPAAAVAWSRFLSHSVCEGAFAQDGPEASAVRLHMIGLVAAEEPEEMARAGGALARMVGDEPGVPLDPAGLEVEALFSQVAAADPRPQVFERWLEWARSRGGDRAAEEVLEAWLRASPGDSRPLLLLAESAERRGALKKALTLLARAEAVERLNPNLTRARFRLTVATAIKHIQNRKFPAAANDLKVLEGLPEARSGGRSAIRAGLLCLIAVDSDPASRERGSELVGQRGSGGHRPLGYGRLLGLAFAHPAPGVSRVGPGQVAEQ